MDDYTCFKGKLGRKRYSDAPTLVLTTAIRNDIWVKQSILAKEDVGEPDIFGEIIKPLPDEKKLYWQARITELEVLLKRLETELFVVDAKGLECPNVYTAADGIDRAEAEAMLIFFLREKYRIGRSKFKWRRAKMVIVPT